jgi:hypothetical protein
MFPVVMEQSEPEALFVRFSAELAEERGEGLVRLTSVVFEEVGRGLWL